MRFEETLTIQSLVIGKDKPVRTIAEISGNHQQKLERAMDLIHTARDCGADAVKFQTYTPETMTLDSDREAYIVGESTPWNGRRLFELYREASTPWWWMPHLIEEGNRCGVPVFSTPFDPSAVAFLEEAGCPAYKIASFELIDHPLLQAVAATGKPILLSTGMASREEVVEAVECLEQAGCRELVLFKCTSAYPAPLESAQLKTLEDLHALGACPVGLSDHTMHPWVPAFAVAQGACVVEKHFIRSRAEGGPDSSFSLEPAEWMEMVRNIRLFEQARGEVAYGPSESEMENYRFRRSLYVVSDVCGGSVLQRHHIRSLRPSGGLPPKFFDQVLGRKAKMDIPSGTPLTWDLIL